MDYEEGEPFNGMPPMKRQKRVQPNPIDTSLIQCRYSFISFSCLLRLLHYLKMGTRQTRSKTWFFQAVHVFTVVG